MATESSKAQVGTLDYALIFAKWSRPILLGLVLSFGLAFAVGSIVPKWYMASATVYPPQQGLSNFALSNFVQNLPFGGFGLAGDSQQVLLYLAILQSRTMMDRIVKKFNLMKSYDQPDIERTIRSLRANVDFKIEKEGTLSISVLDKNPTRAAEMANAFVFYLDSLNTMKKVEAARNNRIYIEKEYKTATLRLANAEKSLKDFQEKFGILILPSQIEEEIRSVSALQAEITSSEIDLRIKLRTLSSDHSLVREAKIKLGELKRKLQEFVSSPAQNNGGVDNLVEKRNDLFIPIDKLPDLGLQYQRLFRDVEVKSKIYELFTQMYEQAKVQEAKDTPTIQVLDSAIPPLRKAKPKRLIWMLIAGFVSTLVTIIYAFSVEYFNRKESEEMRKIDLIKFHLRESFGLRRTNK